MPLSDRDADALSEYENDEFHRACEEERPRWVISKRSRLQTDRSYSGPTWDTAGIRNRYQKVYDDHDEAAQCASLLSAHNPVGFDVVEYW